ncbi:unnamed protein product [Auanema sp. JU1783]|nr:unnamed protein product [Auanema sp. JU1783]
MIHLDENHWLVRSILNFFVVYKYVVMIGIPLIYLLCVLHVFFTNFCKRQSNQIENNSGAIEMIDRQDQPPV